MPDWFSFARRIPVAPGCRPDEALLFVGDDEDGNGLVNVVEPRT